jgi:hypothetical protein
MTQSQVRKPGQPERPPFSPDPNPLTRGLWVSQERPERSRATQSLSLSPGHHQLLGCAQSSPQPDSRSQIDGSACLGHLKRPQMQ